MTRTIVAGIDGSTESRGAAEWAAREAQLLGMPLKLVHVWEPVPEAVAQGPVLGMETHQHWTQRIRREVSEGIRLRHPGLEVTAEQSGGQPGHVLVAQAHDAHLLVLGSRGLGGVAGFLVGSTGLTVVAHTERPVVLVRGGEQAAAEHEMDPAGIPSAATRFRPVVLGLDTSSPDEALMEFAFEAAARRGAVLHVLHGWSSPAYYAYGLPADLMLHETLAIGESTLLRETLGPGNRSSPRWRSTRNPSTAPPHSTWWLLPVTPLSSLWAAGSAAARWARTSAPSRTPSCTTPAPPLPSSRTADQARSTQ